MDYGKIYEGRFKMLEIAKENGWERDKEEVEVFVKENRWIDDYALFMACKRHFKMLPWTEWKDKDLRFRKPEVLAEYRTKLKEDVELFTYIQFLFYKQWNALREYLKFIAALLLGIAGLFVLVYRDNTMRTLAWLSGFLMLLDGVRTLFFSLTYARRARRNVLPNTGLRTTSLGSVSVGRATASKPGRSTRVRRRLIRISMRVSSEPSSAVTSVKATPSRPMRPVRPTRCT